MYSEAGACRLVGVDSFRIRNPVHIHIQVYSNTGYQVGSNIGGLQGQQRPRKVQWLSEIGIKNHKIRIRIRNSLSDPVNKINTTISFQFEKYLNLKKRVAEAKKSTVTIWNWYFLFQIQIFFKLEWNRSI